MTRLSSWITKKAENTAPQVSRAIRGLTGSEQDSAAWAGDIWVGVLENTDSDSADPLGWKDPLPSLLEKSSLQTPGDSARRDLRETPSSGSALPPLTASSPTLGSHSPENCCTGQYSPCYEKKHLFTDKAAEPVWGIIENWGADMKENLRVPS